MTSPTRSRLALVASIVGAFTIGVVAAHATSAPIISSFGLNSEAQGVVVSTDTFSTSSTSWATYPGTDFLSLAATGHATMDIDLKLTGAAVEIRAVRDGHPLLPSSITVDPAVTPNASFTFVQDAAVRAGCHGYNIEWRSVNGAQVTSTYSSEIVTYDHANGFSCHVP